MTHNELVKKAAKWLRGQGCSVVITEMSSGAGQEADAIGWKNGWSIIIECKVSRGDFLREKRKKAYFLKFEDGSMGDRRYYLAPRNVINSYDLPDQWGLLEPYGNGLQIIESAQLCHKKNHNGEVILLVSALRRLTRGMPRPKGISVKAYVYETKNRATLGIQEIEKKEGQ